MITAPRNLPRFLPTLTEVVQPSALASAPVAPIPQVDLDADLNMDLDAIVRSVMQRVTGLIEQRVREQTEAVLRTVVNEQVQACIERVRPELEVVVQQSVTDALAAAGAPGSLKK